MKVKEEKGKVGLKLNVQKTKIMASSPITSWQTDGETVAEFIFQGSKITADGDCSHEIKRHLLGEGGGRGDRDGEYMYIRGWFMSMYDKNHCKIVK